MKNERLNPKQQMAMALYKDPLSPSFGDLKHSFLAAGFKPSYARNAVSQPTKVAWLSRSLEQDIDMVRKAQDNLQRMLSVEIDLSDKLGVQVARLQHDVNKYVLDNLARGKYGRAIDTEDPEQGKIVVNIHQYGKPKEIGKVHDVVYEAPGN